MDLNIISSEREKYKWVVELSRESFRKVRNPFLSFFVEYAQLRATHIGSVTRSCRSQGDERE